MDEILEMLAKTYGLPIIGSADYFDQEDHLELSKNLRKLQVFVGKLVSEHDKLAEKKGEKRLVGKRGRKADTEKKAPETAEDIIKMMA